MLLEVVTFTSSCLQSCGRPPTNTFFSSSGTSMVAWFGTRASLQMKFWRAIFRISPLHPWFQNVVQENGWVALLFWSIARLPDVWGLWRQLFFPSLKITIVLNIFQSHLQNYYCEVHCWLVGSIYYHSGVWSVLFPQTKITKTRKLFSSGSLPVQ